MDLFTLLLVLVGIFILFVIVGFFAKALKWLVSIGIAIVVIGLILSWIGLI
ncbi:hypothetical protein [[Eubacterium] cellulosolvens]